MVKNPPANVRDIRGFDRGGRIPWTRKWQPTLAFLPGEFRGLVGYSPSGHKGWTWLSMHTGQGMDSGNFLAVVVETVS